KMRKCAVGREVALHPLGSHASYFQACNNQVHSRLACIGIKRGFEVAARDVECFGVRGAGEQQECGDGCGVEICEHHGFPLFADKMSTQTEAPQREMTVSY